MMLTAPCRDYGRGSAENTTKSAAEVMYETHGFTMDGHVCESLLQRLPTRVILQLRPVDYTQDSMALCRQHLLFVD